MKSLRALVGFARTQRGTLLFGKALRAFRYDPPRETAGRIPRLMAGRRNNLEDWVTRMVTA